MQTPSDWLVSGVPASRYVSLPGSVVVRRIKEGVKLAIGGKDFELPQGFNLAEKVVWGVCLACSEQYCDYMGNLYAGHITSRGEPAWPIPAGAVVQYVPVQEKFNLGALDDMLVRSVDCRAYLLDGELRMLPGNLIVAPCDGPIPKKKSLILLPETAKETAKWGRVLACSDQYCIRTGRVIEGSVNHWPPPHNALVRYVPQNPWSDDNAPDRELIKSEDCRAWLRD